jgi:hypothetical protein
MTNHSTASRAPRLVWACLGAAVVLCVAGLWLWRKQAGRGVERPGAYVVPLAADSRAGGAWFTRSLSSVRTFAVEETLKIPAGSRVRIVFADGRVEDVSGLVKTRLETPKLHGETLDDFLAVPLAELASLAPTGTNAAGGDVRITSPVGVTRFTNPVVTWASRPETDYDVAVVDSADPMAPPRVAEKVRPPVTLEQLKSPQKPRLQPDRLYEVLVREKGSTLMVGVARILVAKEAGEGALPTEPADLLREAVEAMGKKPTRTGDAWLALSRLPAEWSENELAVRLRLRVALELGLMDEFARAQEAAWRLAKK